MSSTDLLLPTAWLAPPEGLLTSSHPIKLEPAPIAITAILTLIVGAIALMLFNRRSKEIFLDDSMEYFVESEDEDSAATRNETKTAHVQRPANSAPQSPKRTITTAIISRPVLNSPPPTMNCFDIPNTTYRSGSTIRNDRRSTMTTSPGFAASSDGGARVNGRTLPPLFTPAYSQASYVGQTKEDDDDSIVSDNAYDLASKTGLGDPY